MKRIQDQEKGPREKKVEPPKPVAPVVAAVQVKTAAITPAKRPQTGRQVSEDDEIARIKRENKAAPGSSQAAVETQPERQSILKNATPSENSPTDVSQVLFKRCLHSLGLVIEPYVRFLFLTYLLCYF